MPVSVYEWLSALGAIGVMSAAFIYSGLLWVRGRRRDRRDWRASCGSPKPRPRARDVVAEEMARIEATRDAERIVAAAYERMEALYEVPDQPASN